MSALVDCSSVTSYGPNRSVVRKIATVLPIDTGQRVFVQLPHITGSYPASPVGAGQRVFDLTSLINDDSTALTQSREYPNDHIQDGQESKALATKRITSLEAELARLKAQIATYALNESESLDNANNGGAPPPPPPPPPPPVSAHTTTNPVKSGSSDECHTPLKTSSSSSMDSVLKDIGSVTLRNVGLQRSPGGTPMRPKRSSEALNTPTMDDPASVIAHALRKKFSHRIFQDSPDKENLNRSETSFSEFDSPVRTDVSMSKSLQYDTS